MDQTDAFGVGTIGVFGLAMVLWLWMTAGQDGNPLDDEDDESDDDILR